MFHTMDALMTLCQYLKPCEVAALARTNHDIYKILRAFIQPQIDNYIRTRYYFDAIHKTISMSYNKKIIRGVVLLTGVNITFDVEPAIYDIRHSAPIHVNYNDVDLSVCPIDGMARNCMYMHESDIGVYSAYRDIHYIDLLDYVLQSIFTDAAYPLYKNANLREAILSAVDNYEHVTAILRDA